MFRENALLVVLEKVSVDLESTCAQQHGSFRVLLDDRLGDHVVALLHFLRGRNVVQGVRQKQSQSSREAGKAGLVGHGLIPCMNFGRGEYCVAACTGDGEDPANDSQTSQASIRVVGQGWLMRRALDSEMLVRRRPFRFAFPTLRASDSQPTLLDVSGTKLLIGDWTADTLQCQTVTRSSCPASAPLPHPSRMHAASPHAPALEIEIVR